MLALSAAGSKDGGVERMRMEALGQGWTAQGRAWQGRTRNCWLKPAVVVLKLLYGPRLLCNPSHPSRPFWADVCAQSQHHRHLLLHCTAAESDCYFKTKLVEQPQRTPMAFMDHALDPVGMTTKHIRSWIASLGQRTGGQRHKGAIQGLQGSRYDLHGLQRFNEAVMNHDLRCCWSRVAVAELSQLSSHSKTAWVVTWVAENGRYACTWHPVWAASPNRCHGVLVPKQSNMLVLRCQATKRELIILRRLHQAGSSCPNKEHNQRVPASNFIVPSFAAGLHIWRWRCKYASAGDRLP